MTRDELLALRTALGPTMCATASHTKSLVGDIAWETLSFLRLVR
jgi:hypothetical protein